MLFWVRCPTVDGRSARQLYERRLDWISTAMQESAEELGCGFHRAWYTDGGDFFALAQWESREGAQQFYDTWQIEDEPGEVMIELLGDVGLVPKP